MVVCGYVLWILVFAVVAAVPSAIVGGVVSILVKRKGKTKIPALVTVATFVMLFGYLIYYFNSFNGYRGFGDRYRIPIQYPYQISIYGASLAEGCLDSWNQSDSTILCGIAAYAVEGTVMAGKLSEMWKDPSGQWYDFDYNTHELISVEQWFSFTFDTGELVYYPSKQAVMDACQDLGFSERPELKSIREHLED